MSKKTIFDSVPNTTIKLIQFVGLVLLILISIVGCKKDSENEATPDDFGTGYYWTSGYSNSWSDIFIGKDGNAVFFRESGSGNLKKASNSNSFSAIVAVLANGNQYVTPLFILNDLGLPRTISVNDYDLVFCYSTDNKISLAVTNSTGFVASVRGVTSPIDLSTLQSIGSSSDPNEILWKKLTFIKSVVGAIENQLYEKVPDVAGIISQALLVFNKIILLKGTTSFNIQVAQTIANYLHPSDLESLVKGFEILWNLKMSAENIEKALRLLCIDFKTKKLSEVTNETAKYDLESYSISPIGENMSSFDYKTGIRYCFEDGDPTQKGDELFNSFIYSTTVGTISRSFNLKGLKSQQKYKYCAYIQYSDFVDCFEVKTFEPVYVEIISWEPTGAERVADGADHYLYTYSFNQEILLRGDLDFIKDLGIYSFFSSRYILLGTYDTGSNSMWVKIQISDHDYLEYSCVPCVLFKNGQYYKGASVTRHLSYSLKNASLVKTVKINEPGETIGALAK